MLSRATTLFWPRRDDKLQIGIIMGQLRTCNKRHKRVLRVLAAKTKSKAAAPALSGKGAA